MKTDVAIIDGGPGGTAYGPRGKNASWVPVKGWRPERGLFDTPTWSVRRSDFDHMLFTAAGARGASVTQAEAVAPLLNGEAVRGVRVRTSGDTAEDIASEVLLNASGQANLLANAGVIGERFATTQKARSIYLRAGCTMKHLHPIWWRSG